jgi:hypothetical protein
MEEAGSRSAAVERGATSILIAIIVFLQLFELFGNSVARMILDEFLS